MKAADEVKIANAQAKATKAQQDAVKAYRSTFKVKKDATVVQKKIAEAKNNKQEVVTSIEISKLKIDLFNSRKEVEKLWEEKKKQDKFVEAKEKVAKKYKSSDQFTMTWPISCWGSSMEDLRIVIKR